MRHLFALLLLATACRGPATVELSAAPVRVAPAVLAVGDAWIGYDREAQLQLSNPNKSPLAVSLSVSGPFEVGPPTVTLEGGVSAWVTVKFRPTTEGAATGLLLANAIEVPLEGTGVKVIDCDAQSVCSSVAFNPVSGSCERTPLADGTSCTSSWACFASAQCTQGECRGTLSTCDDQDKCTIDTCGASGCSHSAPIVCPALADPCQVPTCVPALGCTSGPVADGTSCGEVDCVRARVCISGACTSRPVPSTPACTDWEQEGYLKAFNSGAGDAFGHAVAVSGDGNTLAVAAWFEDSADRASPANNSVFESGAVYVFSRQGLDWLQVAFLKASTPGSGDRFGVSLALSTDGSTLVVGADKEDSSAIAINGNEASNSAPGAGAAYVFLRTGAAWVQQAYLKPPNTQAGDAFGASVAISATGDTVLVGAPGRAMQTGAAYPFERTGAQWTAGAMIKPASSQPGAAFGSAVALSADAIAIGAPLEAPNQSGAVYVFRRNAGGWLEQAALKAPAAAANANFGFSVALAGATLVGGAPGEDAPGSKSRAGAAHVFSFQAGWTASATLRASNADSFDAFAEAVAISADETTIAIGAAREDSSGAELDNSAQDSGAGYVFRRGSAWSQLRYLKPSNRQAFDVFGGAVAISSNGMTVVLGAVGESSNATSPEGDGANDSATYAGAAYVF